MGAFFEDCGGVFSLPGSCLSYDAGRYETGGTGCSKINTPLPELMK